MRRFRSAFVLSWLVVALTLKGESISLATLNTYWFFNGDTGQVSIRPATRHD